MTPGKQEIENNRQQLVQQRANDKVEEREALNAPCNKLIPFLSFALPLFFMATLALTPGISFTEDLGRHLLLGKIISEEKIIPETNYLTYTHPDFPFTNHHWLSEVFFYQIHSVAGINGLIIFKVIIMTLSLAFAMLAVRPNNGYGGLFCFAGILAAVIMGFRAHIRPELFTYLFTGIYLWLFEKINEEKKWPRFAILLISCIWINLHIYFIFGIGMAAAFSIEQLIRNPNRETLKREALWIFLILLCSLINPHGIKALLYPLGIFSNYAVNIQENTSPLEYWQDVINPMLIALPVLSIILVLSIGILIKQRGGKNESAPLASITIAITSLIASWLMARSSPLLALTVFPVMGRCFTTGKENFSTVKKYVSSFTMVLVFILNLLLIYSVIEGKYFRIFPSPIAPTPFGFDSDENYLRLKKLFSEYGIKGPVFTDFNIGSLVEYELYPEPGFIDNRPEAFPSEFWISEYFPALELGAKWEKLSSKRNINAIIVSPTGVGESYLRELMARPAWRLIYLDELTAIFLKNSSQSRKIIEKLAFNKTKIFEYLRKIEIALDELPGLPFWEKPVASQRLIYKIFSLYAIGEGDIVLPYLWKFNHIYPDYQVAHEILRVIAPESDRAEIDAILEKRAHWPFAAREVYYWGEILDERGEKERAGKVFKRGRLFFPLSKELNK